MKERLNMNELKTKKNGMYFFVFLSFLILGWLFSSCTTTSSSSDTQSKRVKLSSDATDKADAEDDGKEEINLSGSLRPLTISLSNNRYTSGAINKQKVSDFGQKLEASIMKDKNALSEKNYAQTLTTLISAQRLSGAGVGSILETARKYIVIGMRKNVNKQLPAFSKLDVALAAIKEKKLALAEYFLNDLLADKEVDKEIKAGCYTALGMIAMSESRIPEAVELWKKALGVDSDYKAALLNIGFVATQYGDVKTAQATLGKLSSDWYALSGLIVTDRFTAESTRIPAMCSKVLSKNKAHKPALISCGYYELQINHDFKAARSYSTKASSITTGIAKLDEAAITLSTNIDKAQADESRAKNEAKKAKLKEQQQKDIEAKEAKAKEEGNKDKKASDEGSENNLDGDE